LAAAQATLSMAVALEPPGPTAEEVLTFELLMAEQSARPISTLGCWWLEEGAVATSPFPMTMAGPVALVEG